MAWIELHDTLPDHPKVIAACNALHIDKDLLVGKLCRLWTWCLNHREDGFIADYEVQTISEVMRWDGSPDDLFDALSAIPRGYQAGLLDVVDGGFSIHDWDERVVLLMERREKCKEKTRERVARYRETKKQHSNDNVTRYKNVTVTDVTPPTVPNQTVPNHTIPQPLLLDADADAIQSDLDAVFDKARYAGFKCTSQELDALNLMVADYGANAVMLAIEKAGEAAAPKIGYLKGIFKNDPTGGTKKKQNNGNIFDNYQEEEA